MKAPTLYVFNISYYCEKARWALDHFGIAHEVPKGYRCGNVPR
jgi:hypothetical protein